MTRVYKILKSGFTAAFFILSLLWAASGTAQTSSERVDWALTQQAIHNLALDKNPLWHALLHLDNGQPQVKDHTFILSGEVFSPYQEMLATLAYLYGDNDLAVCRFPARYLWLKTHLPLPERAISQCRDINEFIDKAPFDELHLVFATESVTQPASMMGHTFLKISGRTPAGDTREHAISYYTDANSLNLPKLLWESLVAGKKGIFSLTPYERESQKYIDEEQRNLWEYKIRTTAAQRELIRNHLFELKQTDLTYFLHSYNCATVLQNVLGLTGVRHLSTAPWTTPKGVVRQAHQSGLIEATGTYVSDPWVYAFLYPSEQAHFDIPPEDGLKSMTPSPFRITSSQQHHFLKALNHVLLDKKAISTARWTQNTEELAQQATDWQQAPLQLPGQLNPALSQDDSSAGLSVLSRPKGLSKLLNFMPASHRISDKHHHQLAETEVQLFSGSLEITPANTVKLHQFNILSMQSLNPWNSVLKPISSQTNIGYGSLTGHPDDSKNFHAQFAAGITLRPRPDLDVSFLGGGGVQSRPGHSSLFISSEISAIYRASSNTKTLISWRHWQSSDERPHSLKAQQVMYVDSSISLWADVEATQKSHIQRHTLGFGIQKNF